MSLAVVLEKLYARRRFGIKPGVERVSTMLSSLGHPEKSFRTIHVVGTNGKGSTSAFLSSILLQAGYHGAQFSSPHLVRFNERFRINGREYSSDKLAGCLDAVLDIAPPEATFFEITTALAALIFSEERVGIAVVEAGMGGRSDATAALPGEMTIITPISIDHAEYLGATLVEIAAEKAAIAEPGTLIVCAAQAESVLEVVQRQATHGNNGLHCFGTDFSADWNNAGRLDYSGLGMAFKQLTPGMAGRYQGQNAALAIAAAALLKAHGTTLTAAAVEQGITCSSWPGRMELIPGTPPMLLDGAHNPAGAVALAEALADYPHQRLLLITGVCEDKDMERIYAPLLPLADRIYTVTPGVERALEAEKLSGFFSSAGSDSRPCGTVERGILAARSDALPGDLILICGSLFVVGEAKAWLENVDYSGIRG